MIRHIDKKLIEWKNSPYRKPLLIYGARQIGKTYSMLSFGKAEYENTVYCNFEDNEQLAGIFESDLNPDRIIKTLSAYKATEIIKGKTLVIFDEVQTCERALTSLKYFNEQANDYHIVAAGSLLGLAVNRGHFSFPVGKVDMFNMYPLDFEEFLIATGNEALIAEIRNAYASFTPLPSYLHEKALELYRTYLVVGGYPEAVTKYIETGDFNLVRAAQSTISNSYISDMAKYSTPSDMVKSIAVYKSINSQLAKENSKFQYSVVNSKARSKDYELALEWLKTAGVVLNCTKVTEGKCPVSIYEDMTAFKIYYSDIGLLSMRMELTPQSVIQNMNISDKARGMMAENYVAEQLCAKDISIHYWESDNRAEVDFIIQIENDVVPVEIKSADNTKAKSLAIFTKRYEPAYCIRSSAKNFGFENGIKSIPLYALFCL